VKLPLTSRGRFLERTGGVTELIRKLPEPWKKDLSISYSIIKLNKLIVEDCACHLCLFITPLDKIKRMDINAFKTVRLVGFTNKLNRKLIRSICIIM
jgi:hypothetical protein